MYTIHRRKFLLVIKGKLRFFVAFLSLGIIMACSSAFPTQEETFELPGSVVYASDVSGNFEIYHLYFGGRDSVRLTNNTSEDIFPFYLASTNRVGFITDKSGRHQIATMALDGTDPTTWMENHDRDFGAPALSPDGRYMVFVIQADEKNSNLFLSNADGSEEEQLTHVWGMDWDPSWSPDGTQIVYSSNSDSDWDIYLTNVNDGEISKLTYNSSVDGHPRWSADGSSILFESDRDGDWDLYVMDTDGSNIRAITENAVGDWLPSWSPDGKWIVYVSNRDGDDELYIVDVDGKNQMKLTDNQDQDRYPVWIP
jgi:Tol biopolymer transport system component